MMKTRPLFRLDGKIALVTGSTRGIGRSIAVGLAEAGAKVWIHGRDTSSGEQLAKELGVSFVAADLSESKQVLELAEVIGREESKLDVLINNAGFETIMPFDCYRMDVFDRILQVNLRAPVQLTKALLPLLKKSPAASIVNITSIHGSTPAPNNSAYCMAKAALEMFTATLAVELGPLGIRINNLAPGAIRTDMNAELIDNLGPGTFDEWVPMGRVGLSDEMIGPALFLASEASSYVTGTTLLADGGYTRNLLRYRPQPEN
jgi:NAD(P)-dependent dehydrogenase (short-subunit alcohol dehydrogenase family)